MSLPLPARISLGCGIGGLVLVVANHTGAGALTPALERADVLASALAVGLMLVGVLWTRATPETAARVGLAGRQGLERAEGLPDPVAQELGWGSQMLLTATPAAVVLVHWQGVTLLRRGLLGGSRFTPGPICRRAMERDQVISLVNLALYPGRGEFDTLLPGLPAVAVQPLGGDGVVVVGGWAPRCFSRSDLAWLEGWSRRLRAEMLASALGSPPEESPAPRDPEHAAGS